MDPQAPTTRRWLIVLTAAAASATLVGFVSATHRAPAPAGYTLHRRDRPEGTQPAPTYEQLSRGRQSPNRMRQAANLAALASPAEAGGLPHDEAAWQATRARRSERRAYDGAPPVIPHPIDQRGFPSCASCHERGLRIGHKDAPSPSHESHASCTQCHVVAESSVPRMPGLRQDPLLDNSWSGLTSAGKGARAWPGAPPLIPHPTLMRERCNSCHGPHSGLHSSHLDRQSCTQCHGVSAQQDQRTPLDEAAR